MRDHTLLELKWSKRLLCLSLWQPSFVRIRTMMGSAWTCTSVLAIQLLEHQIPNSTSLWTKMGTWCTVIVSRLATMFLFSWGANNTIMYGPVGNLCLDVTNYEVEKDGAAVNVHSCCHQGSQACRNPTKNYVWTSCNIQTHDSWRCIRN